MSALQDFLPSEQKPVAIGISRLQAGGEPVLHEHVHQHHAAGLHQCVPLPEAEGEGQSPVGHDGGNVGTQVSLQLGGLWYLVDSVPHTSGAHDHHAGGRGKQHSVLSVQDAEKQRERKSGRQRSNGGLLLARSHRVVVLLCKNSIAAPQSFTGAARPSQRPQVPAKCQEVLLCPLPVCGLLRALPHFPPHLHLLPDERPCPLQNPANGGQDKRDAAPAVGL